MGIKVSLRLVGINRSLSFTADSIFSELVKPLRRPWIFDLDTTITLIQPSGYLDNPRSGESGFLEQKVPLPLGCERLEILRQEELERSAQVHLEKLLDLNDPYDDDGRSLRNAVVFWQAMDIVGRSIPEDADVVIFARPDLLYSRQVLIALRVFALFLLRKIGRHSLFAPSWGNFGGINDRFALMSRSLVRQYFGRLEFLNLWPAAVPLSSELLLAFAMEGADIRRSIYTPMVRVRIGGRIEQADLVLLETPPIIQRWRDFLVKSKLRFKKVARTFLGDANIGSEKGN